VAFAANSVLSRLALGTNSIDASGYTTIRLLSGGLVLYILLIFSKTKQRISPKGSWISGLLLFLYAVSFSYAYLTLTTGTGALILFAAVQATMITHTILSGHRLHILEWLGVAIAFTGFVYLVMPKVTTPSFTGLLLMTLSGIAWGGYTLRGKGSLNPLGDTTYNFLRTIPILVVLIAISIKSLHFSARGILLASLSGAVTSGIGYTIWYSALRGLNTTQAAVVQLSVPVIAAFGGVLFISEMISLRLMISAVLILGGILLVVLGRKTASPKLPTRQ
jgi:drug/metabolite transporter (DMT)-like permease